MPKTAIHNVAAFHGTCLPAKIVLAITLCIFRTGLSRFLHPTGVQEPNSASSHNASAPVLHSNLISSSRSSSNRNETFQSGVDSAVPSNTPTASTNSSNAHSVSSRGDRRATLRRADLTKPELFAASYKVYEPSVTPRLSPLSSVILLGPWNASEKWGHYWLLDPTWAEKHGARFSPADLMGVNQLRQNSRILDVVGMQMDGVEHAWYSYKDWFDAAPVSHQVDWAVSYVHRLIEQEYSIVGDYRRIALAGLSQGADLALEAAIRFPHQLGMVISERGALQPSRRVEEMSLAAPSGTPFILFAGGSDHYYPRPINHQCCVALQKTQTPVFMRVFSALDHGSWSKREWKLTIKSLLLLSSADPSTIAWQLSQGVFAWSQCDARAACFDREGYHDELKFACKEWAGHDCKTANPDGGYTRAGEDSILQNCRRSCQLC